MTKRQNARSLDAIADDINKLGRANIFNIGDLLIEAKAQCEHGEWLPWLSNEFSWSTSTAERKMRVAEMGGKFAKLTNLKLTATTLYDLADHDNEDDLPAIIDELAKHAIKRHLRAGDAERVIMIGIGRRRFGDRPDATLVQLAEVDRSSGGESWYEKAVAALQERNPETDEGAKSIVDEIEQEHWAAVASSVSLDETDDILDGTPPDLPPPTAPPEPQKFETETDWDTGSFVNDVMGLLQLRTKPVGRFVGKCTPEILRKVADFLTDIAAATETGDKAKAA
jgi:hypothetical protein